jgi:hypothetical protein
MGWFGDIWDSIKSTASDVWSGIKKGAGAVYDVVRKPVDWIAGAGDFVSKIPVLGTIAQPVIAGARAAKSVLDQGKQIADVAKQIGLKSGGMVKERMFQKAE